MNKNVEEKESSLEKTIGMLTGAKTAMIGDFDIGDTR